MCAPAISSSRFASLIVLLFVSPAFSIGIANTAGSQVTVQTLSEYEPDAFAKFLSYSYEGDNACYIFESEQGGAPLCCTPSRTSIAARQISPKVPDGAAIDRFIFNSGFVYFTTPVNQANDYELYRARLNSKASAVRLSRPVAAASAQVERFVIFNDAQKAVYSVKSLIADPSANAIEVVSFDDPENAIPIAASLEPHQELPYFTVSPSVERVLISADVAGGTSLFSESLDGTDFQQLNGAGTTTVDMPNRFLRS